MLVVFADKSLWTIPIPKREFEESQHNECWHLHVRDVHITSTCSVFCDTLSKSYETLALLMVKTGQHMLTETRLTGSINHIINHHCHLSLHISDKIHNLRKSDSDKNSSLLQKQDDNIYWIEAPG